MVTLNRNEVVTLNWKTVVNITEFYTYRSGHKQDRIDTENLRKRGGNWIPVSDHKDHIHIQI
ncbi:hypothetical protein J2Y38_004676 [Flavobacterium sp. 2755]|nr:hypothetical protein [Flavobacterium sp. 2755]